MKKLPAVMIFCMASVLKVRTASSSLEKVTSPDEEAISVEAPTSLYKSSQDVFRHLRPSMLRHQLLVDEWYLKTAAVTMQNLRNYNEDAVLVTATLPRFPLVRMQAVFDGHGGDMVSRWLAESAPRHFNTLRDFSSREITRVCLSMDSELRGLSTTVGTGGSTELGVILLVSNLLVCLFQATIVLTEFVPGKETLPLVGREIVPLMDPKFRSIRDVVYGASHPPRLNVLGGDGRGFFKLHVVQIGDSRALLSAPRGFSALTVDHKPTNDKEKKRIRDAYGDVVSASGSFRINGVLNVSRAFGDFFLKDIWWRSAEKQKVICVPDVRRFVAVPGDILLISSDGVFGEDSRSRETVMDLVRERATAGASLQEIALAVVQRASWDSADNISVILSSFQGTRQHQGEVVEVVSSPRGETLFSQARPDLLRPVRNRISRFHRGGYAGIGVTFPRVETRSFRSLPSTMS